jgi:hypothetical protein
MKNHLAPRPLNPVVSVLCLCLLATSMTPSSALTPRQSQRERSREYARSTGQVKPPPTRNGTIVWSGHVDNVVHVYFQENRSWIKTVRGKAGVGSAQFSAPLPRRNLTLFLVKTIGRGSAAILQQPNQSNDYTCIVRVSDHKAEAADYQFLLKWNIPTHQGKR